MNRLQGRFLVELEDIWKRDSQMRYTSLSIRQCTPGNHSFLEYGIKQLKRLCPIITNYEISDRLVTVPDRCRAPLPPLNSRAKSKSQSAVLARPYLRELLDHPYITLVVTHQPLWLDGNIDKSGAVDFVRKEGIRKFKGKAIISTYHASRLFPKDPEKRKRFNTSLMVHNVLHPALQLENCSNFGCIMAPSSVPRYHGKALLGFCPSCEEEKEDVMLTI